jgi:tetratricopeptide (TPR) repeat protein
MRHFIPITVIAASLGLAPWALTQAAGGGGMPSGGSSGSIEATPQTPEELAKAAYNSGVRSVKNAKGYEDDVAKATKDEKKAKAGEKARKAYTKALAQFNEAVQQQPDMYQAWNYLGFAHRHLGDYDAALVAYAKALQLKPDYAEAIEYRGEAYLGLNQLDAAKEAYMALFRDARPLADQLMAAMQQWLTARRGDAKGVATEDLDAFSKWVDERSQVAQQTASLAVGAPSGWH